MRTDFAPLIRPRLHLPRDYKDFISAYGSVTVTDFLTCFNPFSKNPHLELRTQLARQLSALRELKGQSGDRECPYPLYFEPAGLLPCARTENGNVLYWRTRGHPNQWSIVIGEGRGPEYEEFGEGLVEFLLGFVSGELRPGLFLVPFYCGVTKKDALNA